MINDRIKDLANKGLITQVEILENLSKFSEAELMNMGYISQTGIFDGKNETLEETVMDTPVVEDDAPVVDDEPIVEDTPVIEDTPVVEDDAPVVEDDEPTVDRKSVV